MALWKPTTPEERAWVLSVGIGEARRVVTQLWAEDAAEKVKLQEALRGLQGDPGVNGTDGTNGKDGLPGDPGVNGADGTNGTGRDGRDGIDGLPGTNGTNGRNGAKGRDGIDGKDGLAGTDGVNGKDAPLAIRSSFTYDTGGRIDGRVIQYADGTTRTERVIRNAAGRPVAMEPI